MKADDFHILLRSKLMSHLGDSDATDARLESVAITTKPDGRVQVKDEITGRNSTLKPSGGIAGDLAEEMAGGEGKSQEKRKAEQAVARQRAAIEKKYGEREDASEKARRLGLLGL